MIAGSGDGASLYQYQAFAFRKGGIGLAAEILIVEGDVTRLHTLQDILQTVGYGVSAAGSGQEALEVINPHTHKLVFINTDLPDMGGLELLRDMRPILPNAHVILMTEYEDIIAQQEARQLGRHKWLYLPLRPEEVIRAAAGALEQASIAGEGKTGLRKNMIRKGPSQVERGAPR